LIRGEKTFIQENSTGVSFLDREKNVKLSLRLKDLKGKKETIRKLPRVRGEALRKGRVSWLSMQMGTSFSGKGGLKEEEKKSVGRLAGKKEEQQETSNIPNSILH